MGARNAVSRKSHSSPSFTIAKVAGLEAVMSVSAGREHPVGLEASPLSDAEREGVLTRVRAANPGSDYDFWESWLEA